jgi:hypothetical protein
MGVTLVIDLYPKKDVYFAPQNVESSRGMEQVVVWNNFRAHGGKYRIVSGTMIVTSK